MKRCKISYEFRIMERPGKRPPFSDVYQSIYEQMSDLGTLEDAVLVPPVGATSRQVLRALHLIESEGGKG